MRYDGNLQHCSGLLLLLLLLHLTNIPCNRIIPIVTAIRNSTHNNRYNDNLKNDNNQNDTFSSKNTDGKTGGIQNNKGLERTDNNGDYFLHGKDSEHSLDFVDEQRHILFNEALRLKYKEKSQPIDIIKAVDLFHQVCNGTDAIAAQALHEIGDIYFYGVKGCNKLRRNITKSFSYFNQSALHGYGPALHMMSFAYYNEIENVVPKDEYISTRLEYLAAMTNHIPSVLSMGFRFLYGQGVRKSCPLALKHYKFAAEISLRSESTAHISLQEIDRISHKTKEYFKQLQSFKSQEREALQYWEQQMKNGDPMAEYEIGKIYEEGYLSKPNFEKAAHYYKLAADKGLPVAYRDLGFLYIQGIGVPKNFEKAFECFKKAAELDDPESQNYLGYMYYFGYNNTIYIPKNEKLAMEYFYKAAKQDFPESLFFLGEIKINALSNNDFAISEEDYKIALRYYERAAAYGYLQAYWREAQLHELGKGTARSCLAAVHAYKVVAESGPWVDNMRRGLALYLEGDNEGALWVYNLAAMEGYEVAQRNAGWLYTNIKFDYKNRFSQALYMFQKAVAQGNIEAHYNIADLHLYGRGNVPKDIAFATRSLQKGLAFGDIRASIPLASIYEHGSSTVPKNVRRARSLYRFSLENLNRQLETEGTPRGLPLNLFHRMRYFVRNLNLRFHLFKVGLKLLFG